MMSAFMNDVLTSATLGTVGDNEFNSKDSRGGKVYLATKLASRAMARECIRWSYKELVTTATLSASTNTFTMPATINPNYIQEVWISGGSLLTQKRLRMSTYMKYTKEVLEVSSTPTATGVPSSWYMIGPVMYVHPYANASYTIHLFGQSLPLEWSASASNTTELDVPYDLQDVLHEMALWRLQRIERGGEYEKTKYYVEDMSNKDSLLYKAIFANKLPIKKRLKRWKLGAMMNLNRHL